MLGSETHDPGVHGALGAGWSATTASSLPVAAYKLNAVFNSDDSLPFRSSYSEASGISLPDPSRLALMTPATGSRRPETHRFDLGIPSPGAPIPARPLTVGA